jgi:predicted transcriptional regulator
VADQVFILKKINILVSAIDTPYLGNFIDPLENDSYEVDNSASKFNAMNNISNEGIHNVGTDNAWIKVKKPALVELIVSTFLDSDKKKILKTVSNKPATIPQILDICNMATTMGYRKINSLIQMGLIIQVGFVAIPYRKKIKKYQSIIENIEIHMNKDITEVRIKLGKK